MHMNTTAPEFPCHRNQDTVLPAPESMSFRDGREADLIDFENSPGKCWRLPLKKGRAILASRLMAESA